MQFVGDYTVLLTYQKNIASVFRLEVYSVEVCIGFHVEKEWGGGGAGVSGLESCARKEHIILRTME
jgi:hypothetical protein